MKNHIKITEYIGDSELFEGSVTEVFDTVEELRRKADSLGLVDAEIIDDSWDSSPSYSLVGWRPMTEAELAKAKEERRRDRQARAAAKLKKEQVELETLEKLAKKYGKVIG